MTKGSLLMSWMFAAGCVAWAVVPAADDPPPARIQANDTAIARQLESIVNELRGIRSELEKLVNLRETPPPSAAAPAPARPKTATVKLDPGAQVLGDKNAPLTMVEFVDLQCPFCKKYEETTFAEIRKALIDTGKLRYYSRDFPLDFHPFAMKAAVAVHCAAEQGKFWQMRELLMTTGADVGTDAIARYEKSAALNAASFDACLASGKYDTQIRASQSQGSSIGVEGTPSFLIGKSSPDGVTGDIIVGALPFASFEEAVKKLDGK
jgi:protein-disulfide isomerase